MDVLRRRDGFIANSLGQALIGGIKATLGVKSHLRTAV
jgi:hypothetical protein